MVGNSSLAAIVRMAENIFGLRPDELDRDAGLLELGLDSLMIIKLGQEIERRFGVALETRWFLAVMPSLNRLAEHVDAEMAAGNAVAPVAPAPPLAETAKPVPQSAPAEHKAALSSPVAPVSASEFTALAELQMRTMRELFTRQLQAFVPGGGALPDEGAPVAPQSLREAGAFRAPEPERKKRPHMRGFVLDPVSLNSQQRAFVEGLVARYLARTPRSRALARRGPALADWKTTIAYRPELRETAYPIVADRMEGGRFIDIDGNRYLDVALGMGVHFLGHSPAYVTQPLRERMDRGFGLGPQCDRTADAAEVIARLTGMERVSFCNTGTEAVMFGLRLARARSGKNLVALFNGAYHGTFDGVLAMGEGGSNVPTSPGVTPGSVRDLLLLDYDAQSAFAVLEAHADELAAVLVEPVQSRRPGLQPTAFLRRLRRFTRERGICLIFDEMVNGFRIAPGGAQEHFGVRADMALYGKVIGAGLPIGIVTGSAEYMDYIDGGYLGEGRGLSSNDTIAFGGTFCRHPLAMEAVCAATAHIEAAGREFYDSINARVARLAERLNFWFQDQEAPMRLQHFGPQFIFETYGPYSAFAEPLELPLFYLLLKERGVFTWEKNISYFSSEHSEEDLAFFEEAVKSAVTALREGGFAFRSSVGAPVMFSPMSPTQERIYAILQRPGGQDAYHLPLAWEIRGDLDVELLEISLCECIKRHEALRTSFHQIEGRFVQKIMPEPLFRLEKSTAGDKTTDELLAAFVRDFDLENAPLMRGAVLRRAEKDWLFLLDLLHITADGASLGILLEELNTLMQGKPLAARPAQFREVQDAVDPQKAAEDTAFWIDRLGREAESYRLNLPLDVPALAGSTAGGKKRLTIGRPELIKVREACRAYGVTLNMFLHGAYVLFLNAMTGGERFCVGMADGGRFSDEAAGCMGMFVNTVPLDFQVRPGDTLAEFFSAVRLSCAESMARNHAPYRDIVFGLGFSPARTMLSYERADHRRPEWPGLSIAALAPPAAGAMYDFAVDVVEMDGELHCALLHSEALRPESAAAFGEVFEHILLQAADAGLDKSLHERTVCGLSIIPPRQRAFLRELWRKGARPFEGRITVVDMFEDAARRCAGSTALVFSADKETSASSGPEDMDRRSRLLLRGLSPLPKLTYAELDHRSRSLAARLRQEGVGRGDVVGLLFPRSPDFIVAALGALRAGAAYMPLSPDFPADRIAYQLENSAAAALVTGKGAAGAAPDFAGPRLDFTAWKQQGYPCPAVSATDLAAWRPDREDPAYLIYTSGSTGRPKGVVIEHHSLAGLCRWFIRHYAIQACDRASVFAPFVFDASVWEIFPMLAQGAEIHVLDEETRASLTLLHDYLRTSRITVAYFLSQVAELIDGASLPDLRLLLSGGDVLRQSVPAGNYRHCNTYGPTEYTVTATSFDLDGADPVPIGYPVDNTQAMILDRFNRMVPFGAPGELCLAGEQTAREYVKLPEQTAAAFVPNPFMEDAPEPHAPIYARMYRTGDLCRFLPNGAIAYMGRIDEQVKIRGHRVEPAETGKVLLEHPAVDQCLVVALSDADGGKYLCAYVVPAQNHGPATALQKELIDWARGRLPAYMHPAHIVFMDTLPVGAGGKVDRKALPLPSVSECAAAARSAPPLTEEEKILAAAWAAQVHADRVGADSHFFDLGGDSIKGLMLMSHLRSAGYTLTMRDVYDYPVLREMAGRMKKIGAKPTARKTAKTPLPAKDCERIRSRFGAAMERAHALGPLQHGILFHSRLDPASDAYIEQSILGIRGPLDAAAFEKRLRTVIERHDGLRSVIVHDALSRPMVVTLRSGDFMDLAPACFKRHDLSDLDASTQKKRIQADALAELRQGFDPETPPLFRVRLYTLGNDEHALILTIHHLITDGWSIGIFFSELLGDMDLALAPPAPSYGAYAEWLEGLDKEEDKRWWAEYLEGVEERTQLPGTATDKGTGLKLRAAPYEAGRLTFSLPGEEEEALRSLCSVRGFTANAVLQAAWAVVLARCNRHDDLVFGEVVSGRSPEFPDIDKLFGLCSNTVPVRIRYRGDNSFAELVGRVRENALRIAPHAFLSLAEIQKAANLEREWLTHFFVMENYPPPQGAANLRVALEGGFSRTDFDFAVVWEQGEQLACSLVFNAALYPEWLVESLKEAYLHVLEAALASPDAALSSLTLLSAERQEELLREFSPPRMDYPKVGVAELFVKSARRHARRCALVYRGERLSYAELDALTTRLALLFREKSRRGQGRDGNGAVAICLERGLGHAPAVLAALKAGLPFLPIAPDTPEDRLRYIFEDAEPDILVGEESVLAGDVGSVAAEVAARRGGLCVIDIYAAMREAQSAAKSGPAPSPPPYPGPRDAAYVIYTSGTTGQPKGVLIEHASLTNQALWTGRHYSLRPGSVLTLFAAYAFDVSIWELIPGLVAGCELHVLGEELRGNLEELASYVARNKVTDLWLPPYLADLFLREYSVSGLRSLTAGGDVFRPRTVRGADPGFFLCNNYGPTECAVTAASHKFTPGEFPITIGKPVDNTPGYILDRHGHLQPPGFPGELHLGGVQTGRGYLNRPELTAEKFIPDPFTRDPAYPTMYKSGDLCRLLESGNIEFLGRIDQQVKIRGYRIELPEIEARILAHPAVAQCVVLAKPDTAGMQRLCAYVVVKPGATVITGDALHDFISAWLPRYMTPSDFVFLDSLPLNATGKVDGKRLPVPEFTRAAFVPPHTEREKILAEITAEVLQIERVGMKDDFFALGGDSIKALIVAARLSSHGYKLDMRLLAGREELGNVAAALTRARGEAEVAALPADPHLDETAGEDAIFSFYGAENVAAVRRLLPMQEVMLKGCEEGGSAYQIINRAEVSGAFDPEEIRRRLVTLVERHEALRTVFVLPGTFASLDASRQVVLKRGTVFFRLSDARGVPEDEQARVLAGAERDLGAGCRDISRGPLFGVSLVRLDEGRFQIMLAWHHALLDGWSLALLAGELFSKAGADAPPVSFQGYLDWVEAVNMEAEFRWWRETLASVSPAPSLPLRPSSGAAEEARTMRFSLNRHTDRQLRALACARGLTPGTLLQTAWGLVLCRYSGREEALFGVVVSGRPAALPGMERLIGPCVNTVPLRVDCAEDATFAQAAARCQAFMAGAAEHAFCSVAALQSLAGHPFSDILFVLENQPVSSRETGEPSMVPSFTLKGLDGSGHTGVPFAVEWTDDGRFHCVFHYSGLETWQVEALRDHYCILLEHALETPDAPLGGLSMLSPMEEKRILACGRGRQSPVEKGRETVLGMFAASASAFPDDIALRDKGNALTYAELEAQSLAVARNLSALGIGTGHIVGLSLPRGADFVLAAMGVMLCGAAYLPLEPESGEERLNFILNDAQAALLITRNPDGRNPDGRDAVRCGALPYGARTLEELNRDAPGSGPLPPVSPHALAYVIYTSGSTGRPKGVLLGHKGLANLCNWQRRHFKAGPGDVYSFYAPTVFDASVYEIFPALACGATLTVPPEQARTDADLLAEFLIAERVSVAFLPPMVGKELLRGRDFPAMRVMTFAGDKPGALEPRPFMLLNAYGPTEFTVCATAWAVSEASEDPPIGSPVDNARCYVLDKRGRLLPFGVPGELCMAGPQLAKGYLNRPEENAAAFVPNPFADGDPDCAFLYRSKDCCLMRPDGTIAFRGRMDGQVKILGRRIEPEEIAATLRRCPLVAEVAVIAGNPRGNVSPENPPDQLWAYVVLRKEADGSDEERIRDWLAERLPPWMLPSRLMVLPSLPLTANGKIDTAALPRPESQGISSEKTEPSTDTEKLLSKIWSNVLGASVPDVRSTFLELGGDSVKAMQAVARVRSAGFTLSVREFFRAGTIVALAALLDGRAAAKPAGSSGSPTGSGGRVPVPSEAELRVMQTRFPAARPQDIRALTPMQEGLVFHSLLHGQTYLEQSRLDIVNGPSPEELRERVWRTLERHPVLRSVFVLKGVARPWRITLNRPPEAAFRHEDLRGLTQSAQEQRMDELLRGVREAGPNLEQGPLFSLIFCTLDDADNAARRSSLLVSFHHGILDGWSMGLLARELLHGEYAEGETPLFDAYVDWLLSRSSEEARAFWRAYLDGANNFALPGGKSSDGVKPEITVLPLDMGEALSRRLASTASRCGVTLNILLRTAWALTLARAAERTDILFGVVLSGRSVPVPGVERMVGLFVNTIPARLRFRPGESFAHAMRRAGEEALAAEEHAHLPLVDIMRSAPGGKDLFDHLFVFENLPAPVDADAGPDSIRVKSGGGFNTTNYALSVVLEKEKHGAIRGHMQFDAARFPVEAAEKLRDAYRASLSEVAADPDKAPDDFTRFDRDSAASAPQAIRRRPYQPPAGGLEVSLATIWRDLLHREDIGLDDDFFALGGDSLKVMRLAAAVENLTGRSLDMGRVMNGITLGGLCDLVREENAASPALLPLRKGVGTALVLTNSVGGTLLCYRDIVADLPLELPIYTLPPPRSAEAENLRDMARPYAEALAEELPDGDFWLVGFCLAGLTAWEIAAQLLEKGIRVQGVISLNTRSRMLVDEDGLPMHEIPSGGVPEEAVDVGLNTVLGNRWESARLPEPQLARLRERIRGQLLCWGQYAPPALPLRMVCVRPLDPVADDYLPFELRPLGWEGTALGGMREYYCPGSHFSMLEKPNAGHIADIARACVSRGGPKAPQGADVPLTAIQRWFFGLPIRHGHFFQSVLLNTDRRRPARIYQDALRALVERHDMLRARYLRDADGSGGIRQIICAAPSFGFFHSRPDVPGDTACMDAVLGDIARDFDPATDPPLHCVLSARPDGDCLALMIHHLAVDGVSWRIIRQDFTAALEYLDALEDSGGRTAASGNPRMALPSDALIGGGTFADWARLVNAFAHGPEAERELPHWRDVVRKCRALAAPPSVPRRQDELASLSVTLDGKSSSVILGPGHAAFRTEGHDLILAGVLAAFPKAGGSRVRVLMEGHGRQELFDDVSPLGMVGWFTATWPEALEKRPTLEENIAEVRRARLALPGKGAGYGILLHLGGRKELALDDADILFNFLGDAGAGAQDGPLRIRRLGGPADVGGDFPQQSVFALNAWLAEDGLTATLTWNPEERTRAEAETFAADMKKAWQDIAALCGKRSAP